MWLTTQTLPRPWARGRFLAAGLALAIVSTTLADGRDVMRVHFIDVGQGDATLIEFAQAAVLIDTGGERWPTQEWKEAEYDSTEHLIDYLRRFFESRPELNNRLSLLAITHPHKDHTRGVADVIDEFAPDNVIHNGQWHGSGIHAQDDAREYIRNSEARGYYVLKRNIDRHKGLTNKVIDPVNPSPGSELTDPVIRVLWGQVRNDEGWDPGDFANGNNHSLVVRIDFGNASILFTGDLEEAGHRGDKAGIERLIEMYEDTNLLDADVYQVGHHGSHNGTSPALLHAITPKMAVISAGPPVKRGGYSAWKHAHPRTETILELEAAVELDRRESKEVLYFNKYRTEPIQQRMRKAIYSTGWDGTIILEAKPNGWWTVKELSGQSKP